jgi:multidrug efflux pump subunit AcrA (membrane-fusion protein)
MTRTQPSMETGQHSRVVGTKTVRVNLRPGRARRLSVPLSAFPADRPDGPYYFVVNADSDNGVAETSEVDNVAASARPVQVGPRPARRRRDVDSLFGLTRV